MSVPLRFLPEFAEDLAEGANWYDDYREGLGADFLLEARHALDRISQKPEIAAVGSDDIRSSLASTSLSHSLPH